MTTLFQPAMPTLRHVKKPGAGFTLAEMAIVVLIIGISLTMGLKMVTSNLENSAYAETKNKQNLISTALISFLRTNKRLPCPDTKGITDGVEVACAASAAAGYGVVPWITLGLPRETAQDGWGNLFTYRVANGPVGGTIKDWTTFAAAGSTFDIRELTTLSPALTISDPVAVITPAAVVVILSHGRNGFGAKTINAVARMPTVGAGPNEITNAVVGAVAFARAPVTDVPSYDDLVTYMTPQDLLLPLINEKTLFGACPAYCTPGPAPCSTTIPVPIGHPGPLAC